MQCPQRVSLRFGVADAYGDVSFQTVRGRLSGCKFTGDWWIRAMPMFGTYSPPMPVEGWIQEDGSFSISGQMDGERYIVIIGKAKSPLKTVGIDVTAGRAADAGVIDMSSACPK